MKNKKKIIKDVEIGGEVLTWTSLFAGAPFFPFLLLIEGGILIVYLIKKLTTKGKK